MKKSMSLLLVFVLTLFAGIAISKAILVPVQLGTYDCTEPDPINDGLQKKTICKVGGKATKTAKISGTEVWTVEYNDSSLNNTFRVIDDSGKAILVDNSTKTTKTGGSFTIQYSGNVTKGEDVVLFSVEFVANNDSDKDCGGKISPTGKKGESTTDDTDDTIDDEATGVSVPMMIIAVGTVTGLAIYSVASRKTKMHRI